MEAFPDMLRVLLSRAETDRFMKIFCHVTEIEDEMNEQSVNGTLTSLRNVTNKAQDGHVTLASIRLLMMQCNHERSNLVLIRF